jgi:hypothetical protein
MTNHPEAVRAILFDLARPPAQVSDKVILDKDYSITTEGKPVDPEDPSAYLVLGGKGGTIPRDTAEQLGLRGLEEYIPYHPNAEEYEAAEKEAKAAERQAKAQGKVEEKKADAKEDAKPERETEEDEGRRGETAGGRLSKAREERGER